MENPCEMHQILPWLFLGSRHARGEEYEHQRHHIGMVLDLSNLEGLHTFEKIKYKTFDIDDRPTSSITPIFTEVCKALDEWNETAELGEEKQSNVFVHCNQGVSRSASVVIAYLIKKENMDLKSAFRHVKDRRRIIMPNTGFWEQLVDWEEECRGETSVVLGKYGQLNWK
mmetsp:Transcript_24317/g.37878  ORF Transcript_24317/g.37878 Transcript_24317/m.37878 type:complete len:170 (-) Transcript_24317:42-551(-)